MRKITKSFLAIASIAILASCSSDKDSFDGFDYSGKSTVQFNSNIVLPTEMTRVVDNSWEAGDAIGLYAVEPNAVLEDGAIFDGKKNIKYTTAAGSTSKFVAAVQTEALQLKGNKKVDVIAYYPFNNALAGYNYSINLANQSNFAKIDLLYSDNLKGIGISQDPNLMVFKHQLSKIIFQIEPGNGISSVAGAVVKSLENIKVDGKMNIQNGAVTINDDAKVVSLTPKMKTVGSNVLAEVIALPGQSLEGTSLNIELNGLQFKLEPKSQVVFESGKKYTFRIQLASDGTTVIINPTGSIEDWVEGNPDSGVIVITPGGETPSDKVSVNTTKLNSSEKAEVLKFNITAPADKAWTLTADQNWVTIDPATGNGSSEIKVTTQENTTTVERSANILLTVAGQSDITISVVQAAKDNGGQPGQEVVVMNETFGVNDGAKFDVKFDQFDAYTGFVTPNVKFSNKGSRSDIRARSNFLNFEKHMWFPAYNPQYPIDEKNPAPTLEVSGLNTQGMKNIKISFDVAGNMGNEFNTSTFTVEVDGNKLSVPSVAVGKDYTDKYYTLEITSDVTFSTLLIKTDATNGVGIRLDNVKVIGTK